MRRLLKFVAIAMSTGCTLESLPSQRVDSLILDFSGVRADDFEPGVRPRTPPAAGFSIEGLDFANALEHQVSRAIGRSRTPARELERLVLRTADSVALKQALVRIQHVFREPPIEACATRANGASDRALIWRVGTRGGVIVRTPAPNVSHISPEPWDARLILVRHAIRRGDVGKRVFDLPCPMPAADDMVVAR